MLVLYVNCIVASKFGLRMNYMFLSLVKIRIMQISKISYAYGQLAILVYIHKRRVFFDLI